MAIGKFAFAALAAGGAYIGLLSGEKDSAWTFDRPAASIVDRLTASRRIVDGTGLGSLTIAGAGMDGNAVRLSVTRAGERRSAHCRVHVEPLSPDTSRARLDCAQADVQDERRRRLGAEGLAIIVGEHIAATALDRPYDIDRVADATIAFIVRNRPLLAQEASGRTPPP